MITVQDVQDAIIIGAEKAKRIMANVYVGYYEPDVQRDMDIAWAKTPKTMKSVMRQRMPEYTKKLDARNNKGR